MLERLARSSHKPELVVTRPPRPKGRGRKLQDPPVAELARELDLALFQPQSVNEPDAVERIGSASPQALAVCAFGAIVAEPLLSSYESFNVHPSILPRWRGAAPIERAIAAGDAETGVSIMRLVAELDAGAVCAQSTVKLDAEDDYGSLSARLAEIGGELLVEALDRADSDTIEWAEQAELPAGSEGSYAEKITREDRLLDPTSATAVELIAMIRALNPHIGALLGLSSGEPLRVEAAQLASQQVAAGKSVAIDGRLYIGARDAAIELLAVRPAGGRSMDVESYLRGNEAPQLEF